LRMRQAKNFMALLLLSQGVPMIRSGDEIFGTQSGNNNAYCQDNELSWFDWKLAQENRNMLRFVTGMIAFRRRHPSLMRKTFLTGKPVGGHLPDVTWHGQRLHEPPWQDREAQVLAYTLGALTNEEEDLHIMLNMSGEAVDMEVPEISGVRWHCAVDTYQLSPADIPYMADQPPIRERSCKVAPRSVVVLEGRRK